MKRLFTLLLIALTTLSCEVIDEKLDDLLNKRDWVVFADGTELTVDVPSEQTVLNYKFESTLDWELTTESEWLEIDPTNGKAGKDIKIQIKVLHNKDKEGRTGYVDLTLSNDESYRITVNQAGEGEENDDIIVDIPHNQIWYTSVNGEIVEPYSGENNNYADALTTFGVNIVSNTYADSKGVIEFDSDVTIIGDYAFYYCSSLTSVTIPDSVTEIGDFAFYHCETITSVTLGQSVEYIGFKAFDDCISLTEITIPDSVHTIGVQAFCYCTGLSSFKGKFASEDGKCLIVDGRLIAFAIGCDDVGEYVIPDGVTEITNYSVYYCKSMSSLVIPDSVIRVGEGAFCDCSNLNSVTISDKVEYIGEVAFNLCHSLTSVYCKATIPPVAEDLYWESWGAFDKNASDRKIYVPAESYYDYISAEGWRDYAEYIVAYDFEKGEVVEVEKPEPGNPDDIENNQIWYTSTDGEIVEPYSGEENNYADALTTFGVNIVSNTYVDGKGVIEFDGDVTSIGYCAFFDCTSLTSVIIPDSVTTIGFAAFYECYSLTSVTIGDSVTEIGNYAFQDCSSLTSITIPDSVTKIGEQAFCWCESLTSVTIPDSVTSIGESAFSWCESLTSVTIPDSVTTIGNYAFRGCSSLQEFKSKFASEDGRCLIIDGVLNSFAPAGLTEYTIPDSVNEIGEGVFCGCTSLTSVTIPDGVTSIGMQAFAGCTSLTSVTIGNSVTEIGEEVFCGCTSLTSVTIPDSVTSIGNNAFNFCTSLTNITIPDSVTEIGEGAFAFCYSLTSVTIPGSVTEIGERAFQNCTSLTSVYCKPTTPPTVGYNMFGGNALGRKIYVPMESLEAYKSAYFWSNYASYIVGYNF